MLLLDSALLMCQIGCSMAGRNVGIDFEQLFALENYFWGMTDGLSLELGALDGTSWNYEAPSMTAAFLEFGWNRILIEANPTYRIPMAKYSPESFSINAGMSVCFRLNFGLFSNYI